MAGRGVDIKLGEGVREAGGLYVLGTERHESRRIDNQLRGRSGRQGDPGESRFYLSGEDDLVRLFAGDRIKNIMERFKLPDDQPMEAKILSNQIENAQKKVEEQNFVSRKNVLKYDDVMNTQRHGDLRAAPPRARGRGSLRRGARVDPRGRGASSSNAHRGRLCRGVGSRRARRRDAARLYGTDITVDELRDEVELERDALVEEFVEDALESTRRRRSSDDPEPGSLMRELERYVILQVVDTRWREHLESMDYLREGVHLRALAQKDPLVEYRGEGHVMFEELERVDPRGGRAHALPRRDRAAASRRRSSTRAQAATGASSTSTRRPPARTRSRRPVRRHRGRARRRRRLRRRRRSSAPTATRRRSCRARTTRVGRNDPCWCGSAARSSRSAMAPETCCARLSASRWVFGRRFRRSRKLG